MSVPTCSVVLTPAFIAIQHAHPFPTKHSFLYTRTHTHGCSYAQTLAKDPDECKENQGHPPSPASFRPLSTSCLFLSFSHAPVSFSNSDNHSRSLSLRSPPLPPSLGAQKLSTSSPRRAYLTLSSPSTPQKNKDKKLLILPP